MNSNRKVALCALISLGICGSSLAFGQAANSASRGASNLALAVQDISAPLSRIVAPINETRLVRLSGNTHPLARPEFDKGLVDAQLPMERMLLLLKRSPQQEAALEAFMARQLDPHSADFHHWLEPAEFGQSYGPSDADIATVSGWLQKNGFTVNKVANGHGFIEFSGTAGLVQKAFHTQIHHYTVKGVEHIANNSDPSIPLALSPVVGGIVSLHNFFLEPLHRDLGSFHRNAKTGKWTPENESIVNKPLLNTPPDDAGFELVSPYDFATIYNVLPLWTAGVDGTGQTIAIAGRSDINLADIATFRTTFGLPTSSPANTPTIITNGPDPGIPTPDDKVENTLDVEWSGAVAKGASITFVTTASTNTTDGAVQSALYIIDNHVAPIMSFSYGQCELALGTAGNSAQNAIWQQGATEGITEFVASGDQGSAACDGGQPSPYSAQFGLAVSGVSSTPYNVAVGGTDLNWVTNPGTTYWSATNASNGLSALGYIPEVPWNGTCASDAVDQLIGATSLGWDEETTCEQILEQDIDVFLVDVVGGTGGASSCTVNDTTSSSTTLDPTSCSGGYSKPSWQTGTGVPADGKRDVPDVSLFASSGALNTAYAICDSDSSPCDFTDPDDVFAQAVGGTSVSSPAMAGIMALVLQQTGGTAQGLPNPTFYQLAATDNLTNCNASTVAGANSCIFYDVTSDNNAVPCAPGSPNCTVLHAGDQVGILNGYTATTGYDLATGLGSVNAFNLVHGWPGASAPAVLTSPTPGSTLTGSSATFKWSSGTGVTEYVLGIGNTGVGSFNLYNSRATTATQVNVTGIPTGGATIYVRLFSLINGAWQFSDYTYTEFGTPVPAALTSPAPGTQLTNSSATFQWSAGSGVTEYVLGIGTTGVGSFNLYNSHQTMATQASITGLPTTGVTLYVRLNSLINGVYQFNDYTYTAEGTPAPATLTSPAPSTQLTSSSATFQWSAGTGVAQYVLGLGTTGPGSYNLYNSNVTKATQVSVTGLPTNGVTIYARIYSLIDGVYQFNDYTYTAEGTAAKAALTSPAPGSVLTGSNVTFQWSAGSGVTQYVLGLGTAGPGSFNLYNSNVTKATQANVTGLPTNGTTIFARIYSLINGVYQFNDYTYTAQ